MALPPLDHLRAFEAAARHLSFQKAAQELNVTPAAVSQRIRTLEARLGTALFKRLVRAVVLTDAGQALALDVRRALEIITGGLRRLEAAKHENTLTISTTATFAERCLLPRLPRFNTLYPDVDVRIVTTNELVEFADAEVDIAVRFGRGRYGNCRAQALMDDLHFPVCVPGLLDSDDRVTDGAVLTGHTLIHTDWPTEKASAPTWAKWFEFVGTPPPDTARNIRLTMESIAVRAAIDGQGIALVHHLHVLDELSRGTMVRPFGDDTGLVPEFRYFVVWRENALSPLGQSFKAWLLAEFELSG